MAKPRLLTEDERREARRRYRAFARRAKTHEEKAIAAAKFYTSDWYGEKIGYRANEHIGYDQRVKLLQEVT